MSETTLQTLAYSLGIEKNIRDMSEAEKAQLRYIQVMKSSTEWQTDMGRTLNQPANALRVLKQQFTLLVRTIGNLFIPILMKSIPYIIAFVEIVKDLAQRIADFFGIKMDFSVDYSSAIGDMKDVSAGITDIGDSADKTKNKLNTMLAPFDDLNVVQNQTSSASDDIGGLGGAGDLGVDLPEYDALANLTDKFRENINSAKANLEKLVPVLLTIGGALAAFKVAKGVLSFFSLFTGGASGLTGGISTVATSLGLGAGGLGFVLVGIAATIAGMVYELPKLSKAFDDVVYRGKSIKEVTKEFSLLDVGIMNFINVVTGGVPFKILAVVKGIQYLASESVKSTDVIRDLGDELSETSKKKLTPLVNEVENFSKSLDNINFGSKIITQDDINTLKNSLGTISTSIINELDTDKNSTLKNMNTLEKALGADKLEELKGRISKYYDEQKIVVSSNQDEIYGILQRAMDNNRTLTDDELGTIRTLLDNSYEKGIRAATENSDEYYQIMGRLKNNLEALTTEQAADYIQKAAETRDKSIEAAEEQYTKILGEAEKMKDTGVINDKEYKKIVKAAKTARKEAVEAANKQYDEIYTATTDKLGKNSKYIDKETGKIKTNWQVFVDGLKSKWDEFWSSDLGGIVSGALKVLKTIVLAPLNNLMGLVETGLNAFIKTYNKIATVANLIPGVKLNAIDTIKLPRFEQGGFPQKGELFFANENGVPEMIGQIGNQAAVANNDQITTSITNALLSALDQYDFGGGKSPTTIYIGNKKVYEGYGEYAQQENDRYGTNMIRI